MKTRGSSGRGAAAGKAPPRAAKPAKTQPGRRSGPGTAAGDDEVAELTPREIVAELDKYVIGQAKAKKAVAIALRNRWRRWRIDDEIREEIQPANIILIGPTGVGKTELARRLAFLAQAPFVKVEASKFTEVGYMGRDVESMVRDLVELSVGLVREEHIDDVEDEAWERVDARLLDLLQPPQAAAEGPVNASQKRAAAAWVAERKRLVRRLRAGRLDDRKVEIEVAVRPGPPPEALGHLPFDEGEASLGDWLADALPPRKKQRRLDVADAQEILFDEEVDRLIDHDKIVIEALDRAENTGIVFIDEIDKIAAAAGASGPGPDVSRAGVQRDLLPVVEGTNVPTRYGMVKTEHMLFIAAGAFHHAKPSDLIPELQGRFPIRVELAALTEADFVRILTEPENAPIKQYKALLAADGTRLRFERAAIREIAALAGRLNATSENIGARRLQTVLATLLEDILFDVPDPKLKQVVITREDVRRRLEALFVDPDTARFIL